MALAFIIPFCDKNLTNINTKLKLQLYECPSVENKLNPITIFQWWKSKDWIKKPAYLKITLKAIFKNENLQNINKIKSALIENTLKLTASKKSTQKLYANHQYSLLERPKSAHCKIPNRLTKCIDNSERGSTLIKFSCCGKYLACSSLIEKKHIIIIYKVHNLIFFLKMHIVLCILKSCSLILFI